MRQERSVSLSRRAVLKAGGSLAGYVSLSALLNACGINVADGGSTMVSSSPTPFQRRETPTIVRPVEYPTPTLPAANYPVDDIGLIFAGGQEKAEERLQEIEGVKATITRMQAMILSGFQRQGYDFRSASWLFSLNEQAGSWTMMIQDNQSKCLYWPKITKGSEAGQLVRSGNLFRYLDRPVSEDFFDLLKLQNPLNLGSLEQTLVADKSGWFVAVAGARKSQNFLPLMWFNANKDQWLPLSSFKPEGAAKVELRGDKWVGVDSSGEVGWVFNKDKQEWEKQTKLGLIGSGFLSLEDLPPSYLTSLSPESTRSIRFNDEFGQPLPYGYYKQEDYEGSLYRIYLHLRYRGVATVTKLPDSLKKWGDPDVYNRDGFVLFDIPTETKVQTSGAESGQQYLGFFFAATQESTLPVFVVRKNNINDVVMNSKTYLATFDIVRHLPEGASVILGIGLIGPDPAITLATRAEWARVVDTIREGKITESEWPLGANPSIAGYDSIYVSSNYIPR